MFPLGLLEYLLYLNFTAWLYIQCQNLGFMAIKELASRPLIDTFCRYTLYKEKLDFINNVERKAWNHLFSYSFFSLSDLLSLSDCTPVSETILGSNGFCHLIYPEPITRSVLVPQIDTLDYTKFFFVFRSESSSLWGQQQRLGHFLSKAKHELEFTLALQSSDLESDFIGLPVANNTLWQDITICPTSWNSIADANVLCRSLGHFGGGLPR